MPEAQIIHGQLTITADDYGKDLLGDIGILILALLGCVTNVSVLVTHCSPVGYWLLRLVKRLKKHISIGLHVDLSSNNLIRTRSSRLFQEDREYLDKRFAWSRALEGWTNLPLVTLEIEKQLAKFANSIGYGPSHLDSHNHIHVSSTDIYKVFQEIADKYTESRLRFPRETLSKMALSQFYSSLPAVTRDYIRNQFLASLGREPVTNASLSMLVEKMRTSIVSDVLLYESCCKRLRAGQKGICFAGTLYGWTVRLRHLHQQLCRFRSIGGKVELMVHPGLNYSAQDLRNAKELVNLLVVVGYNRILNLFSSQRLRILSWTEMPTSPPAATPRERSP